MLILSAQVKGAYAGPRLTAIRSTSTTGGRLYFGGGAG